MFTPRQDAEARYYEISAIGTVTPVLEGLVDTKAWCLRRDTDPLCIPLRTLARVA